MIYPNRNSLKRRRKDFGKPLAFSGQDVPRPVWWEHSREIQNPFCFFPYRFILCQRIFPTNGTDQELVPKFVWTGFSLWEPTIQQSHPEKSTLQQVHTGIKRCKMVVDGHVLPKEDIPFGGLLLDALLAGHSCFIIHHSPPEPRRACTNNIQQPWYGWRFIRNIAPTIRTGGCNWLTNPTWDEQICPLAD